MMLAVTNKKHRAKPTVLSVDAGFPEAYRLRNVQGQRYEYLYYSVQSVKGKP